MLVESHRAVAAIEGTGLVVDATGWGGRDPLKVDALTKDVSTLFALVSYALRTRGGDVLVLFRQDDTHLGRDLARV